MKAILVTCFLYLSPIASFSKLARLSSKFAMNSHMDRVPFTGGVEDVYWNEALGIWEDESGRATVKVLSDLEEGEPLYIFGYGSLMWRPGDLLEQYQSYDVDAIEYQRLFAQRSTDHRGTPRFPGLVLTIHPINQSIDGYIPSLCSGRVFAVPESDREDVMAELDFREKGGYTRTVMKVKMRGGQNEAPYMEGEIFSAVVYFAEHSNPLFFQAAADTSRSGIEATAQIIAASEGPSGHNAAYLLQLSHYLHHNEPALTDDYLVALSQCVVSRLCPWNLRGHGLLGVSRHSHTVTEGEVAGLRGWGSNEYGQVDSNISGVDALPHAMPAVPGIEKQLDPSLLESRIPLRSHLFAGGAMSAVLDESTSTLCVWGQHNVQIDGALAACLGHAHGLTLHSSGYLLSFGSDSHGQCSKAPRFLCRPLAELAQCSSEAASGSGATARVWKAACGLRHSAAIAVDGRLFTWGESKHGQVLTGGEGEENFGVLPPPVSDSAQISGEKPLRAAFMDLACGARHTVAIDVTGDVWSFGDNRHGSLGREADSQRNEGQGRELRKVCGLPRDVKWVGCRSGWSHVIVKGVKQDGSTVFYGWGRRDLGQFPPGSGTISDPSEPVELQPLPALPSGEVPRMVEVWCGAEHTVAADAHGHLYRSGWSDHDGSDVITSCGSGWVPVIERTDGLQQAKAHVSHGTVFYGHVAAGGAHSLYIKSTHINYS